MAYRAQGLEIVFRIIVRNPIRDFVIYLERLPEKRNIFGFGPSALNTLEGIPDPDTELDLVPPRAAPPYLAPEKQMMERAESTAHIVVREFCYADFLPCFGPLGRIRFTS